MTSPLAAGLAVAAAAYVGRYGIVAWQAFKARPPRMRRFYEGGFQATMTRREAALILGVRSGGLGGGRYESGFCISDFEPSNLESQNSNVTDVPIIMTSKFNHEFFFILCKFDFGKSCCLAASPPSTLFIVASPSSSIILYFSITNLPSVLVFSSLLRV
ncbi:uncharacterized protein LOC106763165 isoform X1 [Vigna radiata var. radiata]|uniref:Uncharacterized protein LOC106763165 isoform X1 n=1 Tax=Vigna radiata var. radiata TaxID=3916 RepID=A0A3Q0F6L2_VIGRR|nr:uncharacterized protein LOC106763165 isoform X1 [Vigna radiata var. radiata]